MAKLLTRGTRSAGAARRKGLAGKTPAGVWVLVAMGLFFVIGGIGTGAFIAWKTILNTAPPAVNEAGSQRIKAVPGVTSSSQAEGVVERPKPMIADSDSPTAVAFDPVERDQVREEVLKRIDLMRGLSDAEKDKLYVQVERARGFTKIGIVRFTQNGTTPGAAQTEGLITSLNEPGLRRLLADPTVILIMVGYADKQGEEPRNVEISRSRADSVVKVLREKTDLTNIMHTVGMGGQDLFDQSNLDKNRLVEVWAVQP
jgi:outer membrane protein OmpA-like peptidoglycan-associated protein